MDIAQRILTTKIECTPETLNRMLDIMHAMNVEIDKLRFDVTQMKRAKGNRRRRKLEMEILTKGVVADPDFYGP